MDGLRISRRTLFGGTVAAALSTLSSRLLGADSNSASLLRESAEEAETLVKFPPIDFPGVARHVVNSMHPQAGERAVLLFDPSYYPELTVEAELALRDAGVDPVVRLTFPPLSVPYPSDDKAIKVAEGNWDTMLGPMFERTDLFLWLPGRNLAPDLRWERLLGASRARCIHCHFVFGSISDRPFKDVTFLCKLYEHAILHADYGAMSRSMDKIIALLRGGTMRIISPGGTDLEIKVPAGAWFHKSDGDIPKERAAAARSVRDREIEHPGGALRLIPDSTSAHGTLVTRVAPSGVVDDEVTMEIRNGLVVNARARRDDAAFQKLWRSYGGDINKVAEIVIGTNPLLVANLASGELPYYGYGAGALRISFGDNWESGGSLRSGVGDPLWTFVPRSTLRVGESTIIRDGVLQVS